MREPDLALKEKNLEKWLRTKLPEAESLSISALERAGTGFSNETHFFKLLWRQDGRTKEEDLVVRWPPQVFGVFPEYDVMKEYQVMQCLQGTGVPTPKVYWAEPDASILGVPFYIVGKVDGEWAPSGAPGFHGEGLFYEATPRKRSDLWRRSIEMMSKIHSLDWQSLGFSFLGAPNSHKDAFDKEIAYWEHNLNWASKEPLPAIRAAFEWVKKNRYVPERLCLCWGDAGPHNLLYRNDGVAAVLDWEMAHIGPPEGDIAYFMTLDAASCNMHHVPRLEGMPGKEETIEHYEKYTGTKVQNFAYNDVLATLKIAVLAAMVAKPFSDANIAGFPSDFATSSYAYAKLAELLKGKI